MRHNLRRQRHLLVFVSLVFCPATAIACSSSPSAAVPAHEPDRAGKSCSLTPLDGPSDPTLPELEFPLQLRAPQHPTQQQLAEAKRRAAQGRASHSEGARVALERAFELSGDPELLFDLGITYRQMNDYAQARTALQAYLARVPSASAENREEATGTIAKLGEVMSWLEVRCDASPGEVAIDDVAIATCPAVGRVAVNPGRRHVVVTRGQLEKCEVTAELPPRGRVALRIAGAR